MKTCECCETRPQIENEDGPWCLECWRGGLSCEDCGELLGITDEDCTPQTRGDWPTRCETCERDNDCFDWIDETCRKVTALATENGWECGDWRRAQTRSRYITMERGDSVLKVRVSDHGSAYCSEDISIAKTPSGDDHTLEILEKRLK